MAPPYYPLAFPASSSSISVMITPLHTITAILPVNDLDAAERFFARLGFVLVGDYGDYRILQHPEGGDLHLNKAVPGWVEAGRNPFGLYLYTEAVDALAMEFRSEIIGHTAPEDKPWGMYEFAINGPDDTLVRVGWPIRLRQ